MKTFVYILHESKSKNVFDPGTVVFKFVGDNSVEADEAFKQTLNYDPAKVNKLDKWIGLQVE